MLLSIFIFSPENTDYAGLVEYYDSHQISMVKFILLIFSEPQPSVFYNHIYR